MKAQENSEVLDPATALASVGGDAEFLFELAGLVQAAWPSLLGDIRTGLAAGDLGAVQEGARLARAAAEYVSARRTYESALQLLTLASLGDVQGARRASAVLENEVMKLQGVLSTMRCARGIQPQLA
ncbi:MAG TPA: hypothetical protein VMO17_20285 [Terriglobia bacterium]|nr:hypothetical protein [Terriglobia bacterium]